MVLVRDAVPMTFTLKGCVKNSRVVRSVLGGQLRKCTRIVDEDVEAPMGRLDMLHCCRDGGIRNDVELDGSYGETFFSERPCSCKAAGEAATADDDSVKGVGGEKPGCCKPSSCVCA